MKWLVENWSLLVVLACAGAAAFVYVKKFTKMPTEEQLIKVKEWLLYAVTEAERDLGSGTGELKLRRVYDLFIKNFPYLVDIISFKMFRKLVDEALDKMKHLLETNKDIEAYVKGEE